MKKILCSFLILLLIPCFLIAQKDVDIEFPIVDGKVIYSGVVQVDSTMSGELYGRVKSFFADFFKDSKEVIQIDDKERGEVSGRGFFTVSQGYSINNRRGLYYTLRVFVKDNRYKYEVTDLVVLDGVDQKKPFEFYASRQKMARKTASVTDESIKSMINELKKKMLIDKDNW